MSCDPNVSNPPKEASLLELMKNGADINVVHNDGKTHLHRAVERGSAEEVTMLLRYGADVNIENGEGETAFRLALNIPKIDVALVLVDHLKDSHNREVLNICVDLVVKDSILCSSTERVLSEEERFSYFMEFSEKIYRKHLRFLEFQLLRKYLEVCDFSAENWLRCLYFVVELPVIRNPFAFSYWHPDCGSDCLCILLLVLLQENISRRNRIAMIRTWIDLGVQINVKMVDIALYLYGFGDEVEAMIFAGRCIKSYNKNPLPLTTVVLGLTKGIRPTIFFDLLIIRWYIDGLPTQTRLGGKPVPFHAKRVVLETLKFISLSSGCRQGLLEGFKGTELECDEISEKVGKLPKIPSLVEFSRDAVQRKLLQNRRIKAPYQFHEAVKNLDVPREVQDIIRFKRPIYV